MNAKQIQDLLASGKAELVTHMRVQKANGRVEFRRVKTDSAGSRDEIIDEATYYAEGGARPEETQAQRDEVIAQQRALVNAIEGG